MALQTSNFTMESAIVSLRPNNDLILAPSVSEINFALSRTGHTVVAVFLGAIFILGFLGNFLALFVFARFPYLRTPINLLLINISASDMLVCVFGTPFSFAASVNGRWLIGSNWCRWYGFANALFGIVSLVSLAVLSYERYSALVCSSRPGGSDYTKAWLSIGGCWLYSLAWTVPPLLGWSSYGPEGPGTTCSVQWHQHSAGTRSYVSCLFIFCLFLPLLLMLFCYGRILLAIRGVSRVNQSSAKRRDIRALVMVVSMATCYLLCWLPYGIVALVATFGRPGLVPPAVSLVPSLLAKTSTVLNPFIYVLFNNQFYRCCVALVKCRSETSPVPAVPSLPSRGEPHPASSTCHSQAIIQGFPEIVIYPEICDSLDIVKVKGRRGSQEADTSQ